MLGGSRRLASRALAEHDVSARVCFAEGGWKARLAGKSLSQGPRLPPAGQLQKLYVLSADDVPWFAPHPKTGVLQPTMLRAAENSRRNISARECYKKVILREGLQCQLRVGAFASQGMARGQLGVGVAGEQSNAWCTWESHRSHGRWHVRGVNGPQWC